MPQAEARTSEQTITVPLKFVEETRTFANAWLADFQDYAADDFGNDTEQAVREQELARIRYIAETSETLLQPRQPATAEQFRLWLPELATFGHEPQIEPMPDELTEPGSTGLRTKLNTTLFGYAIVAIWGPDRHDEIYSYLGATAVRNGNREHVRHLAEGPVTYQTWRRIIRDITELESKSCQGTDGN